ncbi:MAG: hypothetical protein NTZ05_16450 [Chloroflexi bacterium]|nr:hypothetical protein [Chloroflexota bacterium]
MTQQPAASGWLLLVYRVPSDPSSNRVAVWRDLKRIGALYLQQCVCIVPHRAELYTEFTAVREKVARFGGSSNLFEVAAMPDGEEATLQAGFRELAAVQYAEIVEECETKFVKEVEFEHFRQNYTFAEAEEIEQDLEKIRRWYARVQERDWFHALGRDEVDAWITRCDALLEGFYTEVYTRVTGDSAGPGEAEGRHETPRPGPTPTPLRKPRSARPRRRTEGRA